MKKKEEDLILKMINQVDKLDENMLYSGLTVVAKDTAEYLAAKGITDDKSFDFLENFEAVMKEEKKYWDQNSSPLFKSLSRAGLPSGFAGAAANGKAELSALTNPEIKHEWTYGPGRKFLEKFAQNFKDGICKGEKSIFHQSEKNLLGQSELPQKIVLWILSSGISAATFWYPLAVYIALLILKAGLKTYCEST